MRHAHQQGKHCSSATIFGKAWQLPPDWEAYPLQFPARLVIASVMYEFAGISIAAVSSLLVVL